MYEVVVRLSDGAAVSGGIYASEAEAKVRAEEIVRTARSDGADWPVLGEAFVRPDAIISVALVAGASAKWMGSEDRARWAHADQTDAGATPPGRDG